MNIYEATRNAAQQRGLTDELRIPAAAYTDPNFDTAVNHVGRDHLQVMITIDGTEAVIFHAPETYPNVLDLAQLALHNYVGTLQRTKSALAQKRGFAKNAEARQQAAEADAAIIAANRHYVWTLAAIR